MSSQPKILVVGSLVMDLIVSTDTFPHSGETVEGRSFQSAPGGKGANQAIQAARLGADVTMVGKVGDDFFGQVLLKSIQAAGIHAEHLKVGSGYASAIGNILLEPDGRGGSQNRIIVVPGANAKISLDDIAFLEQAIGDYDMVMLQLEIPMEVNERVAELAAAAGVPVMLNPAPAMPLSDTLLSHLTYLSPNEHEAALLTHTPLPEGTILQAARTAAGELAQKGVEKVIVTLGEHGAVLLQDGQFYHSPCVPDVHGLDPTAAGDSFLGAFCTAVCYGLSDEQAMEFAGCAAALTVSHMGAQPSLPTLREVLDLMEQLGKTALRQEVLAHW